MARWRKLPKSVVRKEHNKYSAQFEEGVGFTDGWEYIGTNGKTSLIQIFKLVGWEKKPRYEWSLVPVPRSGSGDSLSEARAVAIRALKRDFYDFIEEKNELEQEYGPIGIWEKFDLDKPTYAYIADSSTYAGIEWPEETLLNRAEVAWPDALNEFIDEDEPVLGIIIKKDDKNDLSYEIELYIHRAGSLSDTLIQAKRMIEKSALKFLKEEI